MGGRGYSAGVLDFDLLLWVLIGLLAGSAGLLVGAGTRGRMQFRAEPVCRRCRSVVLFDQERRLERCDSCGETLGKQGLLYFRHRWIWSALLLATAVEAVALALAPATAIAIGLLNSHARQPDWADLAAGLVGYAIAPLLPGFFIARSLLSAKDPSAPLCRECLAPLDASAIFDVGACPACKATFLEAGAPRPARPATWGMRILAGISLLLAAGVALVVGLPKVW
jgi:hypothetical protein